MGDVLVIGGGVIPDADILGFEKAGVAAVFTVHQLAISLNPSTKTVCSTGQERKAQLNSWPPPFPYSKIGGEASGFS